jgi:hypothetical protein
VLLDPFEEQLDLPAVSIQVGYRLCRNGKVVGQEVECLASGRIVIFDATQRLGVIPCRLAPRQHNALIASHTTGFVRRMRVAAPVLGVRLGADDKESIRSPAQGHPESA